MKVLITFALANEFAPWRKLRRFRDISIDRWQPTYDAQIGDAEVCVVLTGAGRFAAKRSIEMAFDELPGGFDVCIASGLSGGLKAAYEPGRILAARSVSDVGGTSLFCCDAELVASAGAFGAKIVDKFVVSEKVAASAAEKRSLGALGDAVDMESIYILAAAAQRKIPFAAIRAISDGVDSDLPLDFDRAFSSRGAVSIPKVVGQLVQRPGRLGRLVRLAGDCKRAATELARFLDRFVAGMKEGPLTEFAKAQAVAL